MKKLELDKAIKIKELDKESLQSEISVLNNQFIASLAILISFATASLTIDMKYPRILFITSTILIMISLRIPKKN